MYGHIFSGMTSGISGRLISVETDISAGLPGMSLVGYLSSSVKEAGERVRTALKNCGFNIPPRRITINLFPADIHKTGTNFDLAIAISILFCMETAGIDHVPDGLLVLGELGLDGNVRRISGILPIVHFAKMNGFKKAMIPYDNYLEAKFVDGIDLIPVKSIIDAVRFLSEGVIMEAPEESIAETQISRDNMNDLKDIFGQEQMKRGLKISVAGKHHLLLQGAAGSGKSMIAGCAPGLMPDMTKEEMLEVTKIYSVAGRLSENTGVIRKRPFRSPHSNITQTALIGGGAVPMPGEISLASGGVLFLDEFPEFSKKVIESLRAPLEDKKVTVSRAYGRVTFPADFMLITAKNNCPCGAFPDRNKCRCRQSDIDRYNMKISHPIMDRIDIRINVRKVDPSSLLGKHSGESTKEAKADIDRVIRIQRDRFKDKAYSFNSEIPIGDIPEFIKLSDKCRSVFDQLAKERDISARGTFKLLRLIRTIADLSGHSEITEDDIREGIYFRNEEGAWTYE